MLAGAPIATPTVVWAPEVPPGPKWLMDFVSVGGLRLHSQRPGTHLYSQFKKEAIVCDSLAL